MSRLVVQRTRAFGDVIAASAIATHLFNAGHTVSFQTDTLCQSVLLNHPHIAEIRPSNYEKPHIDLGDIEVAQRTLHIQEAYGNIAKKTVPIGYPVIVPRMVISDGETVGFRAILAQHKRPWIFVCPGSWQAMNRTVSKQVWSEVFDHYKGTLTWVNPTHAPVNGAFQLPVGTFRQLMAAVSLADVLVTVDSGPMHVGASLGIPMVVVEQAWPIYLRMPPGVRYELCSARLPCSPCREHTCKLPHTDVACPPCQFVSAESIVESLAKLLIVPSIW